MAMNAQSMADLIITTLKGIDKPDAALPALSNAIKTYIETNCQVQYSWVAVMPPPSSVPDPIVIMMGKVTFTNFSISLPQISEPNVVLAALAASLLSNITSGMILPIDPTFVVTPGTFLSVPFMLTQSKLSNQKDALEYLCNEIILGIKAMVNPVPLVGVHLSFIGTPPLGVGAIMTQIL